MNFYKALITEENIVLEKMVLNYLQVFSELFNKFELYLYDGIDIRWDKNLESEFQTLTTLCPGNIVLFKQYVQMWLKFYYIEVDINDKLKPIIQVGDKYIRVRTISFRPFIFQPFEHISPIGRELVANYYNITKNPFHLLNENLPFVDTLLTSFNLYEQTNDCATLRNNINEIFNPLITKSNIV